MTSFGAVPLVSMLPLTKKLKLMFWSTVSLMLKKMSGVAVLNHVRLAVTMVTFGALRSTEMYHRVEFLYLSEGSRAWTCTKWTPSANVRFSRVQFSSKSVPLSPVMTPSTKTLQLRVELRKSAAVKLSCVVAFGVRVPFAGEVTLAYSVVMETFAMLLVSEASTISLSGSTLTNTW